MEENPSTLLIADGRICSITFSVTTFEEICKSSVSDSSISHPSQLTNPFLGLPVESGKCESCGTVEHGKCEGHFGYIQFPIPIYHPAHISELKRILSLICLKCLRMKKQKMLQLGSKNSRKTSCVSCQEVPLLSIRELKPKDGACLLQLKVPTKSRIENDSYWNFLNRYGFPFGGDSSLRSLLPLEALQILKSIPEGTKKKLAGKGYVPQDGFILQCLPVPPNCLSVPDVSDGTTIMSSDLSLSMLKKVLNKIDVIKRSRSGIPNFESHEIEATDLQSAVAQYLLLRGTTKAPHDMTRKFVPVNEGDDNFTKAWLEKMRTLFIRKGSGFSSRSVITGDSYRGVNEVGIPIEIAQKITFEEKVTAINLARLQDLVDNKLCVTYRDGSTTYAIREGSKGHTYLKVGQVIHRRIMDGDIVFINRPPSTHKHSLQAFTVYVHEDHTVKINPLICGPLGADFDGDCVHIFYPQSLAAKAEVVELFSVERQMVSSHSGNLNLQLTNDSILALKHMFRNIFIDKASAQQLSMHTSPLMEAPALIKAHSSGPSWTFLQLLGTVLPSTLNIFGERYFIIESEILKVDFNRDIVQSLFTEIITSIFDLKGPKEALKIFNLLQPLLMEVLFLEGYSIGLNDFDIPKSVIIELKRNVQAISPLLHRLRRTYDVSVELEVESHLKNLKLPLVTYIRNSSSLGNIVDSKSDSSITKVVQQLGFLGLQLFDRGKFYSKSLVDEISAHIQNKICISGTEYPSEAFGLIKSSFIEGLNPFETFIHSISSREVLLRSSRGLTEPGILFKNLMAILRDVVLCYDGTIRHSCGSSVIQFGYGAKANSYPGNICAGEPVGVLAATAISNPAYKAVLDSSQSNSSSWELMKEILLCRVAFKNDVNDRKVILYLNDCCCGKKYCKENAAYVVQSHLKKAYLKDFATSISIEYQKQRIFPQSSELDAGLVSHIHLDKRRLTESSLTVQEILHACQDIVHTFSRKKKHDLSHLFKSICLTSSECCCFGQQYDGSQALSPCLQFTFLCPQKDTVEKYLHVMADIICPIFLETVVKGDSRVKLANIVWIEHETTPWVRNPSITRRGEVALEIVVEKDYVKEKGDAWRIVLDCCLPVMNLINSERSIPYGVQQIQELLGISAALNQSVQRLSQSLRAVTKGVLVEHIILVANSMAHTGNLIGFNASGFKALFHSLQVEMPFTEATLFRPMKCFEKAAEKCHTDSLSSIVASCSWGKHVAIGTGMPFRIIWNKEETSKERIDVYSFLQLVRSSHVQATTDACLGVDIDDLQEEHDNLSPEHNPEFSKASFDYDEIWEGKGEHEKGEASFAWEQAAAPEVKSGAWGSSWDEKRSDADKPDWGSWKSNEKDDSKEKTKADTGDDHSWRDNSLPDTVDMENILPAKHVWNTGVKENQNGFSKPSSAMKQDAWNSQNSKESHSKGNSDIWGGQKAIETNSQNISDNDGWNRKAGGWVTHDSKEMISESSSDGWGSNKGVQKTKEAHTKNVSDVDGWGSNTDGWGGVHKTEETHTKNASGVDGVNGKLGGWGASVSRETPSGRSSDGWGPKTDVWGSKKAIDTHSEDVSVADGWNKRSGGWNAQISKETVSERSSDGWGSDNLKIADVGNKQNSKSSWDAKDVQIARQETQSESPVESVGWPSQSEVWNSQRLNEASTEKASDGGGWNTNTFSEQLNQQSSQGWGSKSSFGKGSASSPGWGSSNNPDRKGFKSRFSRPPGKSDDRDGKNPTGIFTATGKRMDIFTSDEEKVLNEVEPIMLSIKRIMRNPSYNDGDRFSAEDQSFILDNVFNFHPDKQSKMGDEITYVMIDKHASFQDSRCLYVVSKNDFKADFSYRKCMENFVRTKHPEIAEVFNGKYFSRRSNAAESARQPSQAERMS